MLGDSLQSFFCTFNRCRFQWVGWLFDIHFLLRNHHLLSYFSFFTLFFDFLRRVMLGWLRGENSGMDQGGLHRILGYLCLHMI